MKRVVLVALMMVGITVSVSAQHDDLYFVPKKKTKVETSARTEVAAEEETVSSYQEPVSATRGLDMDEDAYNRRGAFVTEQGEAVSEFVMNDDGFVLITEEGDTMWMDTDTLKLTRVKEDEGWVNGFDGSDSDYEYAMRIVRFRNPRYAIPVSSPLYWDVVYGGALWPSWDWNIYDDGLYAYVFPTANNWLYWDYRMSYPFGWSPWGSHWNHHWGWHYGHHWGGFYGNIWYDPWYDPFYCGYYPGWHHGYHHGYPGYYPGIGHGKPGWGGVIPGSRPRENDRHAMVASTRRGTQDNNGVSRGSTSTTRREMTGTRTDGSTTRSPSVRVVTGRSSSSDSRASGVVRSTTNRSVNDDVLRRGGSTSSSVGRSATTGSSSRSSYTRQSTSRSSSGSSYNRPSSTRSSSSSVSRSSSSSRSGGYSSGSSSSSYSSGSSSYSSSRSSSSYSSGSSSYSSSSRSSSSYGGGSSYSGGSSSRSSGGSYGGGSRSGGSSGSRR